MPPVPEIHNDNPPRPHNNDDDDKNHLPPSTTTTPTVIIRPSGGGPPYVRCTSSDSFVNPLADPLVKTAKDINATLHLNLGLTMINPDNVALRKTLRFLMKFLLMWWEHYFFALWDAVPLVWRQRLTAGAWKIYLPLHKLILGRSTGIHPDASLEYHALTTVMWWGRLFPVTVKRMRFALSQLIVCHPRKGPRYSRISPVCCDMRGALLEGTAEEEVDEEGSRTVTGYYVQKGDRASEKVVFWLYGGAYLSGDAWGNTTIAEGVSQRCGVDVFLPSYRLMPEYNYDQILWDVVLAYIYLLFERRVSPSNIILLGISSGGGLVARCLQAIAEVNRGEALESGRITSLLSQCLRKQGNLMPRGGVLLCPFVDYTDETYRKTRGSFEEYPAHDLVVNQSVIEEGVPYLAIKLGDMTNRARTSPVYRSFQDLPPLCVVASEHEAVFDQSIDLVNKARAAGVPVTLGLWKYMCHVFSFMSPFIPEGQDSMDFACQWIDLQFGLLGQ